MAVTVAAEGFGMMSLLIETLNKGFTSLCMPEHIPGQRDYTEKYKCKKRFIDSKMKAKGE
ncbi:MAG: hypothetical protein ACP5EK_06595 [Thermoplasmatota archaeon]